MNDDVARLIEAARRKPLGNSWTYASPGEYEQALVHLVVQQCVDILMKPDYVMKHPERLSAYNKGWVNGRLLGIDHIKDYFGVDDERTTDQTQL